MAVTLKKFDSLGGYSVSNEVVITENKDIQNVNTLQIKNNNFSDITKTNYILKGTSSQILELDNTAGKIILDGETINFITVHIVGTKADVSAVYSVKLETTVSCDISGNVSTLTTFTTVVRDDVPDGETWTIVPYDSGAAGEYSLNATVSGTTDSVKWVAAVEVLQASWA